MEEANAQETARRLVTEGGISNNISIQVTGTTKNAS